MTVKNSWIFTRTGGFDQVVLNKAEDLIQLEQLDPKLWTALACPVKGLFFDEKCLKSIDVDNDGRVRQPEVVQAVKWACGVVKNPEIFLSPDSKINLSDINDKNPDGAVILESAQKILINLNKTHETFITLDDVDVQQKAIVDAPLNGDGVVLPTSTQQSDLSSTLETILKLYPGVQDVSGKLGVDSATVLQFFTAVDARSHWLSKEREAGADGHLNYAQAYATLSPVRAKIDDYFSRCRASVFDARALDALNQPLEVWATLSKRGLSSECSEFLELPLAAINTQLKLKLTSGLNPAWQSAMDAFIKDAMAPVFGDLLDLTLANWSVLKQKFDAYQSWLNSEGGKEVASLSSDQLSTLINGTQKDQLIALIEADLAVKPLVDSLGLVEKLLRFRLHLKELLNNFVNFSTFYATDKRAVFEAGTLFLDGRACELCIEVLDAGKHAALAGLSKCYLAYCECTRPDGAKKSIVAAFTGGDADYLLVGRNGVFFDRAGQDWDATISKIIENPISISQAFFLPYKRFIRFIEERAAKGAAAADANSQSMLENVADKTTTAIKDAKPHDVPKPKFDVGTVAAMGVAIGGITTAMGMMLNAFFGLGLLMPLGIVGLLVLISGPSVFIAWLKLRQRNLGPILDASGWAINGQVKINTNFGGKLTEVAKLPQGAKRSLVDPYADKAFPWKRYVFLTLLLIGLLVVGWSYAAKTCPLWMKPKAKNHAHSQVSKTPAAIESK